MKTSDDLFQLIKSLSKPEKRYFKLFASMYGGEKNYLRLFDAIDAQAEYDEAKLREQFSGERFVRQLNVAKRYLFEQILRSLRVYHTGTSVRAQMRGMMQNIEILHHKDLRQQARKVFDTALAFATEHEDFVGLLEVLAWAERLEPGISGNVAGTENLFGRYGDTVERLGDYLDHALVARKLGLTMAHGEPRTREDLDALEAALCLMPRGTPRSVRAELLRAWGYAIYHYGRGENLDALRYIDRQVELLESNPGQIEANPFTYLAVLGNRMEMLRRLDRIDLFWSAVEKVRGKAQEFMAKNQLRSPRIRAQVFTTVYTGQMLLHLALREPARYPGLIEEVREGLRIHGRYLGRETRLLFQHGLSRLHFEQGELARALDYNLMIVQAKTAPRTATYSHARLVHLVIHYELGNLDLLEYLIPSTYRYFRSRNILHGFEAIILDFFNRLMRLPGGARDLIRLMEDTRDRLAPLANDPLESNPFLYFRYVEWLNEKIAALRPTRAPHRAAAPHVITTPPPARPVA